MAPTGYYIHRDFWKHEMGRGHPECPERLDAIEDRLLLTGVADALERHDDIPLASLAQITRAHTAEHLEHLESLNQRLVADESVGGRVGLAHVFLRSEVVHPGHGDRLPAPRVSLRRGAYAPHPAWVPPTRSAAIFDW